MNDDDDQHELAIKSHEDQFWTLHGIFAKSLHSPPPESPGAPLFPFFSEIRRSPHDVISFFNLRPFGTKGARADTLLVVIFFACRPTRHVRAPDTQSTMAA